MREVEDVLLTAVVRVLLHVALIEHFVVIFPFLDIGDFLQVVRGPTVLLLLTVLPVLLAVFIQLNIQLLRVQHEVLVQHLLAGGLFCCELSCFSIGLAYCFPFVKSIIKVLILFLKLVPDCKHVLTHILLGLPILRGQLVNARFQRLQLGLQVRLHQLYLSLLHVLWLVVDPLLK